MAFADTEEEPDDKEKEWVLIIPKRLTQSAQNILIRTACVSRPWHLEGRFGGRIHQHDNGFMGIPVLSESHVLTAAKTSQELRDLLDTANVDVICKPISVSTRARDRPPHDARIHPEREGISTTRRSTAINGGDESTHRENSDANCFTYAELFAGIGGFGVALEALGGQCVFASEIEEACRDVFAANFPIDERNLHGDIYQVTDHQLPFQVDLLVGGFPCQPFSAMGEQPGLKCPKGHLFLEIVRVLKVSKPQAFLLENVPGLQLMEETFATVVSALEEAGYTVLVEACDARCLTATSRKRLFFFGLRNDLVDENNPFEVPFVPDLGLRARNVIDYTSLSDAEEELLRVTYEQLQRLNSEKYWRPAHLAWPNAICHTLVSHYGKAVARGESQLVPTSAYSKNSNPRRFTPRECGRIMGFPNSFVLPEKKRAEQPIMGRTKELYRMFGNAVCPPLIAALAGALLEHCPQIRGYKSHSDWVLWGRETAIRLARKATITQREERKDSKS